MLSAYHRVASKNVLNNCCVNHYKLINLDRWRKKDIIYSKIRDEKNQKIYLKLSL